MTASDGEIDRALATIHATLNEHRLEQFDPARVQEIVTGGQGDELVKVP